MGGLLDFRVTPNLFRIGLRFGRSLTIAFKLYPTLYFQVSDVADKFHVELIQTEYWLPIG